MMQIDCLRTSVQIQDTNIYLITYTVLIYLSLFTTVFLLRSGLKMAIKISWSDSLAKFLDCDEGGTRLQNLVWLQCKRDGLITDRLNLHPHERDALTGILEGFVKRNTISDTLNNIRGRIKRGFLPEKSFDWIDEKYSRQTRFILKIIPKDYLRDINPNKLTSYLNPKDLIKSFIDIDATSASGDQAIVDDLHQQWIEIKSTDTYFKWYKNKDTQSKIEFTFDWIKNQPELTSPPYWLNQTLDDLMTYFDFFIKGKPEKELLTLKIKKNWSQNNYRRNLKGKRQCNFILKNHTIKNLEKLSQHYNLSMTEILDTLINMESSNKSKHIEEKMRYFRGIE